MQIWSERPGARAREIVADVLTLGWVVVWATIGIRLYGFLANLAGAGRLVRDGGSGITNAGVQVGAALQGIPLVGEGAADGVRGAFSGAGDPLMQFGTDLERLLIVVAALLGLLVVAVALAPWLNRYLPWRVARWRRLNAAARVIRRHACREGRAARGCGARAHPGLARAPSARVRRASRVHPGPVRRLGRRAPRPAGAGGARPGWACARWRLSGERAESDRAWLRYERSGPAAAARRARRRTAFPAARPFVATPPRPRA